MNIKKAFDTFREDYEELYVLFVVFGAVFGMFFLVLFLCFMLGDCNKEERVLNIDKTYRIERSSE